MTVTVHLSICINKKKSPALLIILRMQRFGTFKGKIHLNELHINIYNQYVIVTRAEDLTHDSILSRHFSFIDMLVYCTLVSYITHNAVQLPADSGAGEPFTLSPPKRSDAAAL